MRVVLKHTWSMVHGSTLQDSMLVVLRELKQALKQRISQEDWLDDVTKKRALNKADKINEFLAYPKEIKNNAILNNIYSQVVI